MQAKGAEPISSHIQSRHHSFDSRRKPSAHNGASFDRGGNNSGEVYLADRRPSGAVQQELRQGIDRSHIVHRTAGLGSTMTSKLRPFSAAQPASLVNCRMPVQLDAVRKDVLNVVGENHAESDQRRDKEKDYTESIIEGGGYWRESEFKSDGKQVDPLELQIHYLVARIRENAKLLKETIESRQVSFFCGNNKKMNMVLKRCEDQNSCIRRLFKLLPLKLKKASRNFLRVSELSLEMTVNSIIRYESVGEKLSDLADNHIEEVNRITTVFNFPVDKTPKNDFTQKRSRVMHAAANNEYERLGIWKVGDRHRKDMSGMNDRQYNLVSRKKFNRDLKRYAKQNR